jgi:hypothetical protein
MSKKFLLGSLSLVFLSEFSAHALPGIIKIERPPGKENVLILKPVGETSDGRLSLEIQMGRVVDGKFISGQKFLGLQKSTDELSEFELFATNGALTRSTPAMIFSPANGNIRMTKSQKALTTNTLNSLTPADQASCLTCDWSMGPEGSKQGASEACEDLGMAACLNSDGSSKFDGKLEGFTKTLKDLVDQARLRSAQTMGHTSADDSIRKEIEDFGIAIKKDISSSAKKYLYYGDYASYSQPSEMFSDSASCAERRTAVSSYDYYNETNLEKLHARLKISQNFESDMENAKIKLQSRNIPSFVGEFRAKCTKFLNIKKDLPADTQISDPALSALNEICTKITAFRTKAVDLFRKQARSDHLIHSEKFIREHLPALKVNPEDLRKTAGNVSAPAPPTLDEAQKLKNQISEHISRTSSFCSDIDSALNRIPEVARKKALTRLDTSRTTVEFLIGSIFTDARKSKIDKMVAIVRAEAKGVVDRINTDSNLRKSIHDSYDRLILTWLQKPDAQAYKKDSSTGAEVIDTNKLSLVDPLVEAFGSSGLNFFTQLNAYYKPLIQFASQRRDLNVTMMPIFLLLMDENPFAFLSVLAHEMGHNIGPQVSRWNGFDMTESWQPMTSCLADENSIRLQQGQEDEAIADTISAEILASILTQLPAEKRRQAAQASIAPFCMFSKENDSAMTVDCLSGHPEPILRTSGIFGGNLDLRRTLGCKGDATRYRSCGLSGL